MTNLNIGQEILCTRAFNLFMAAIALKRLRHPTNEKLPFGRKYAITDHRVKCVNMVRFVKNEGIGLYLITFMF